VDNKEINERVNFYQGLAMVALFVTTICLIFLFVSYLVFVIETRKHHTLKGELEARVESARLEAQLECMRSVDNEG
jgi:Na+/melibiose symporter-like transporter